MIPPSGASDFLARHGWADAEILPLAGDASFRRYFRIQAGEKRAVLMDAPPPHEDPRPFVAIANWLEGDGGPAAGRGETTRLGPRSQWVSARTNRP